MKALIKGVWYSNLDQTENAHVFSEGIASGTFRGKISADGSLGFKAEAGRYHLYTSYACPFAHRTLIMRKLKKLEKAISISVLDPSWNTEQGWAFTDAPDCTPDTVNGFKYLYQVYVKAQADFTGKVTVPVLWDKASATIVNNESADIMRMLNSEFEAFAGSNVNFYQKELQGDIDAMNEFVTNRINLAVYRVGFAMTQDDYDREVDRLFAALDELESHLSNRQYLVADGATEADWRLFVTLVRFDAAYYGALRCNVRRLADYPNLSAYTRRLYRIPGVARTVKLNHIKRHYYNDLPMINHRIVPKG
ncbi:MAG: glutathione S-transferase family protein, partial [Methylococcales bacterium]